MDVYLKQEWPLIVTDKNLAKSQFTINVQDSLSKSGLKVNTFSEVDSNPNEKNLETGLNYLKEVKADGILAFGGGSAIDLAKLLAFMYSQDRPVWDFEDREDWWKRASGKPTLPVIAIPTTAGTGSEVGRASVLTDKNSLTKKIIFHPTILPNLVILPLMLDLTRGSKASKFIDFPSVGLSSKLGSFEIQAK